MRYPAAMLASDPLPGLLAAEPLIRLGVFAGVLALLVAWEALAPRRAR